MYISLAKSHANGFNKWCAAYDAGGRVGGCIEAIGPIAADDRKVDAAVITFCERPHYPWLVPGAGTL